MPAPIYHPRLADGVLSELLAGFPALMVTGPRAAGKTTTAARLANQVVRLDEPGPAAAFRADPDAALRRTERPVLLDEWQNVPAILGAVKRAVDAGAAKGSFILAGSVGAELDQALWPATGRVVRLAMHGLTEQEVNGTFRPGADDIFSRLASGDPDSLSLPSVVPDLPAYLQLAVRGSFPEPALHLQKEWERQVWVESYLDQLLSRDAIAAQPGRDPARLRRYFEALAASTAGQPSDATLCDAAGISARTAAAYDTLLERLFVTDALPAYSHNRLSRLARTRKRYVVDGGLVAGALAVTADDVLDDPDLFGRMVDTFAVAQLRPQLALAGWSVQLFHLRDRNGRHEIDVLVDLGRRGVLALEIKAGVAPSPRDATHLTWLRERLGKRFVAGVVLHTGPAVYDLGERIMAVPLCVLWG